MVCPLHQAESDSFTIYTPFPYLHLTSSPFSFWLSPHCCVCLLYTNIYNFWLITSPYFIYFPTPLHLLFLIILKLLPFLGHCVYSYFHDFCCSAQENGGKHSKGSQKKTFKKQTGVFIRSMWGPESVCRTAASRSPIWGPQALP